MPCPCTTITGQCISMWLSLEKFLHCDTSCSKAGASPLEPLRMLSQSSRKFLTSSMLLIFSMSMSISTDFASINGPFIMACLLNDFATS